MKRLYKLKIATLAMVLAVASSCKDFLDVNTDPNNLVEVPIQFLLPGAQVGTGFLVSNTVQIVNSLWMQQIAGTGTQTDQFDRYNVSPNDFNNEWNLSYATLLDDLREIETKGQAEGNFITAGMAQVLQAYVWAVTADTWGDIPFRESLSFDAHRQPVYDPQQEVYTGILALVDAALANLAKTNVIPNASGDQIYNGNVTRWVKAANSLKLKLLVQSRHRNPGAAAAIATLAATPANLINANADNFNVPFFALAGSQNPIYQYNHLTRVNDQLISTRFYDSLRVLNDPRIPYLFTPVGTNYVTYDNGVHTSTPFVAANRSRWGIYVVGNGVLAANGTITGAGEAPVRLITHSMVQFWLAEAALTLGTPGDPATLFENGIRAHFEDIRTFNNVTAATFTPNMETYIAARKAAFAAKGSPQGKLNVLIRDKWVTTAGNAYEAYNDHRRTGFPRLALAQNAQPGVTRIPTRWPYAQFEIQANAENVPIKEYPAGIQVPVWWMPN